MDEQLSLLEAVETVRKFRLLIKDIDYYLNWCADEIATADKAFSDVRHFIELSPDLDSMEENAMVTLIKDYSRSRRKAKDFEAVLEPLKELVDANPKLLQDIGKANNEMERKYRETNGPRSYRYRVLEDELTALRKGELTSF